MLSYSSRWISWIAAGPSDLRMPLAPSGSGKPVCSFHQTPRSTTSLQILVAVGELAFVNDQAGVDLLAFVLASDHRRNDLVERHFDRREVRVQAQPQREIRAGQLPRHGDRLRLERFERSAASW